MTLGDLNELGWNLTLVFQWYLSCQHCTFLASHKNPTDTGFCGFHGRFLKMWRVKGRTVPAHCPTVPISPLPLLCILLLSARLPHLHPQGTLSPSAGQVRHLWANSPPQFLPQEKFLPNSMFCLKKSGAYNFLHQVSHRSISFEGFSSQCTSQLHLCLAIRNLHSKLTTLTLTSPHDFAHCELASARAVPQNLLYTAVLSSRAFCEDVLFWGVPYGKP